MSQSTSFVRPRLMLILPPALSPEEATARIAAGDVAAVIVARGASAAHLRALAPPLQRRDCAVLVEDAPDSLTHADLDGRHVTDINRLAETLRQLKPQFIVGIGGLSSRHAAMEAGESGVDYVLFGSLDGAREDFARIVELVAWWSELFEVPCAAVATTQDDVDALATAGADFIVLAASLIAGPDGVTAVAAAQARIDAGDAPSGSNPDHPGAEP